MVRASLTTVVLLALSQITPFSPYIISKIRVRYFDRYATFLSNKLLITTETDIRLTFHFTVYNKQSYIP